VRKVYGLSKCSNVNHVCVCALQICRQQKCLCVLFSSAYITDPLLSSSAPINMYIYIHTTNLLPLASAPAVLMGETHSYNSRALGVPADCASRYRRSPRLLLPPTSLPFFLLPPEIGLCSKLNVFF